MRLSFEITLIGRCREQRDNFLCYVERAALSSCDREKRCAKERDRGRERERGAKGEWRSEMLRRERVEWKVEVTGLERDGWGWKGWGWERARAVPLGRSQVVPFATVTQPLHVSIRLSNFEFQRARAHTHLAPLRDCVQRVCTCIRKWARYRS